MQGFLYLGGNECHMFSVDLNKVPNNKAIAIVMTICSSILGPFWFIFQFTDSWFEKYNLLTLLLICGSIGFPVTVLYCAALYLFSTYFLDEKEWPRVAIITTLFSIIPYYIPGLFNYTKKIPIEKAVSIALKIGVSNIIFVALLGICLSIFKNYINKNSKETKEITNTLVAPADPLPPNPHPETQSGT